MLDAWIFRPDLAVRRNTPNACFRGCESEILIVPKKMLGDRIDEFMKDDSVSTRPGVPNGRRRNVAVNHLLLNRSSRLPRTCCRGARSREVLR
jgi:hypothetical protein